MLNIVQPGGEREGFPRLETSAITGAVCVGLAVVKIVESGSGCKIVFVAAGSGAPVIGTVVFENTIPLGPIAMVLPL